MQNHEYAFDDLTKFTVAIQETKKEDGIGRALGTGIIVTNDGLILTCYHVVGNLNKKTIDFKNVDIYFPSVPNIICHAKVLEEYSDYSSDIAFLQLQEKLSEQVAVANLSETIDDSHAFKSFGFRKPLNFDGLTKSLVKKLGRS